MIAIIPARGGSTRIPRKNIRNFHGKPIIQYSIETAQKSGLFDAIIVSTEDNEISRVAWSCGALVSPRDKELAADDIGTQEVAQSVLKNLSSHIEYACVIYATSPLLSVEDLRRGLDLLRTSRSLNYAYATDLRGKDAGAFYWGKTQAFIDGEPLHENHVPAKNTIMVPLSPDRVCDINYPSDWDKAVGMYLRLRGSYGH